MDVCMYVLFTCVRIYICMYVCINIYVCTYVHTYVKSCIHTYVYRCFDLFNVLSKLK